MKNGITWRNYLNNVKMDMDEYGIKFTSTHIDDMWNYLDGLKLWYKDFTGKEVEDSGDYGGWYRIMQSFIFENLNYERGRIIGITEDDWNSANSGTADDDLWNRVVFINEDKLDDAIDSNLIYIFSYDM